MATRDQVEARIGSSMLLNIGAGLISSIVIYVSFTEARQVVVNWPFLALLVFSTGVIFEWGRVLAHKGER
jgi:hypothetical protein